ncbi:hypothetical protein FEM54_07095 [Pseudomonas edaphica]|uniref:Secreted protein n=1 Tax=Pseudomonas edaphica TaxID=2006980 RepID=A0ABY2U929_9PSED|nr:hypothetical protein FEM54_07095 [Pseudomonas edaphica]
MRIRGKLQNFAKAAILAITQKNCSTPCTLFCRPVLATPLNSVRFYRRYMNAHLRLRQLCKINRIIFTPTTY